MKTRTKALLIVLCATLLVAVTALTTIAWLTSIPDAVTNTFTFGDGDNIKIELDEAKVDAYGDLEYKDADKTTLKDRVKANEYKLLPGHEYTKDPTIHVKADSIDCYLFVTIKNDIAAIEADTKIAAQMAANGWVIVEGYTDVYAYYGVAAEGEESPNTLKKIEKDEDNDRDILVFEKFKIIDSADATELAKYATTTKDGKQNNIITVNAYAVQADGFEGKSAKDVWEAAFSGYGTKETTQPKPAE